MPEINPSIDKAIPSESTTSIPRLISFKLYDVSNLIRDVAKELQDTGDSDPGQIDTAARLAACCASVLSAIQSEELSEEMARQALSNPHRMRGVPLR
jgi:hypothetical protein